MKNIFPRHIRGDSYDTYEPSSYINLHVYHRKKQQRPLPRDEMVDFPEERRRQASSNRGAGPSVSVCRA